jgi:hypothetical protein
LFKSQARRCAYEDEDAVGADSEEPLDPLDNDGSPRRRVVALAPLALLQFLKYEVRQGTPILGSKGNSKETVARAIGNTEVAYLGM